MKAIIFLFFQLAIFVISIGVIVWLISFLVGDYVKTVTLLKILVWPLTVLGALFLFRKVFAYTFLSLDGFNFFGARGTLRPPQQVIEERAQQIVKEKEDIEGWIKQLEAERLTTEQAVRIARELLVQNTNLQKQQALAVEGARSNTIANATVKDLQVLIASLQVQINELLAQISALQREGGKKGSQEE